DGDVDIAAGVFVGLLKGLGTHKIVDDIIAIVDGNVPVFTRQQTQGIPQPQGGLEVVALGDKVVLEFLVGAGAQLGADPGPGTGAGQHLRQQLLLRQGMHHPVVEVDQPRSATQGQRGAAQTMAGAAKEIEVFDKGNIAFGSIASYI